MRNVIATRAGCTWRFGVVFVLALSAWGCGSGGSTEQKPVSSEAYGTSIKSAVNEFCVTARTGGAKAAKSALSDTLERLEGYEEQHLGEHFGTYQQVIEKLKSLQTLLAGSPSNADVKKAADELAVVADKLPGEIKKGPLTRQQRDPDSCFHLPSRLRSPLHSNQVDFATSAALVEFFA